MMCASVNRRGGGEEEVATVVTTAAVVLALLLLAVVALLWRLYNDGMRRADAAARLVAAERAKADQQQLALRRYEVAFASISGRGPEALPAGPAWSVCHSLIRQVPSPIADHPAC